MKRNAIANAVSGVALFLLFLAPIALLAQDKVPITTSSDEAKEFFIKGRDQLERFHFTESIEHLKTAIDMDPQFAMAYLYLAQAEEGGKQFSRETLDKAIELADKVSPGEKHMIHFVKNVDEGDEMKAVNHMEALLDLYPEDERVHMWSGYYHFINQDYEKAIDHFNKAIKINSKYHPAHNMLGYSFMNTGKMDEAEKSFKNYLELLPENANPHDSYAEFLQRQGRFDESIKHYNKALEIDPNFVASYKGLADNYLFQGNFRMARDHYRNYHKKNNNTSVKFNGLLYEASVDLHENKPDQALETMKKYTDLAEEMDLPYYKIYGTAHKGYILSESGKTEEGLKHYKKAIKMIEEADLPEHMIENLKDMAHLWEFYALISNEDFEASETAQQKCYDRFIARDSPALWKSYYGLCGFLEIKRGNYGQARTFLTDAWDNPTTWYYTGLAWHKEGNKEKARKYYKKVTEHYNNDIRLSAVRNKAMAGLEE